MGTFFDFGHRGSLYARVALCCFQQEDVQGSSGSSAESRCDFGPPGVPRTTHRSVALAPGQCACVRTLVVERCCICQLWTQHQFMLDVVDHCSHGTHGEHIAPDDSCGRTKNEHLGVRLHQKFLRCVGRETWSRDDAQRRVVTDLDQVHLGPTVDRVARPRNTPMPCEAPPRRDLVRGPSNFVGIKRVSTFSAALEVWGTRQDTLLGFVGAPPCSSAVDCIRSGNVGARFS